MHHDLMLNYHIRSYVELVYHIVHMLYGVQCGYNLISSEGDAANKMFTKFLSYSKMLTKLINIRKHL